MVFFLISYRLAIVPSLVHKGSSAETSGPDIMALITGFPSSDFPAWVALKASMAWLKEKLFLFGLIKILSTYQRINQPMSHQRF